jgi:hypothetical protein
LSDSTRLEKQLAFITELDRLKQALRRMQVMRKSSPELWRLAQDIIRLSIEKGYLAE